MRNMSDQCCPRNFTSSRGWVWRVKKPFSTAEIFVCRDDLRCRRGGPLSTHLCASGARCRLWAQSTAVFVEWFSDFSFHCASLSRGFCCNRCHFWCLTVSCNNDHNVFVLSGLIAHYKQGLRPVHSSCQAVVWLCCCNTIFCPFCIHLRVQTGTLWHLDILRPLCSWWLRTGLQSTHPVLRRIILNLSFDQFHVIWIALCGKRG